MSKCVLRNLQKRPLEIINKIRKVVEYKINIKRSIIITYTSNKPLEIQI
jgi:hypothetical protein